ncbi:hypothetical protein [Mesorhizobium sp. CA7]|uniref:hypothetical protein n=1 Tax=Mesorhizobium sp. CA7 TaxID=588501 RepID=UPI002961FB0D|nr:hypothetical protein [Mesorhizobium sp. CA7]
MSKTLPRNGRAVHLPNGPIITNGKASMKEVAADRWRVRRVPYEAPAFRQAAEPFIAAPAPGSRNSLWIVWEPPAPRPEIDQSRAELDAFCSPFRQPPARSTEPGSSSISSRLMGQRHPSPHNEFQVADCCALGEARHKQAL